MRVYNSYAAITRNPPLISNISELLAFDKYYNLVFFLTDEEK